VAKAKNRARPRKAKARAPEDAPAAGGAVPPPGPVIQLVWRLFGPILGGIGWIADVSVHLTLGILCVLSAGLLYVIAGDEAGSFVYQFMAVQVLVGGALSWWGLSRIRHADPPPSRLDELKPKRFFLETWKRMDEEAREERLARKKAGLGWDYRPILSLCVGAVCLSLMEYFGGSRSYEQILTSLSAEPWFAAWGTDFLGLSGEGMPPLDPDGLMHAARNWPFFRLTGFAWWSGWRVLGYFLIPAIALRISGQRIRDQGLETKGWSQHAWIYGLAYGIVLVCVVIVSYTDEFSTYYPFYKLATRSWFDFLTWELLYAAQFLSLEFFFRGWWLKALKPMMGSHAIFAMIVPYCMIHFGKPFPETLAAIVAGIVLGTLAMKTRSIWSGFLIHVSVAVSMDMAALLQTTGLPTLWFPDL